MEKSYCERERTKLERLNKFQLPNKYKKVGLMIAVIVFGLMIAKKFVDEPDWVKPVLNNLLLLGMLMVSISKEKIEDEYIDSLRSQSYRLAFVLAVIYSLIQPGINYVVGLILDEDKSHSFSYFQVLFFMLIVQLMFFYQLKRFNR